MFSCCKPAPEPEENPLIFDVHEVIKDKAWKNFVYSYKFYQRSCIRRKDYVIEVPDNYFVFEQIEQSITPRKHRAHVATAPSSGNNNAGPSEQAVASTNKDSLEGKVPSQRATNPEVISIDTEFANDTAKTQTYEFRFEKTRTTSVEVSYQKGFTVGTRASFSIGVPKILGDGSIGLETETQYEVSKSEGQTFEESMTLEATSSIVVGPKSCYVAKVQLEERSVHADFVVRTRMIMPQKRAPIYIRRKSDNEIISVYSLRNLKDVFNSETAPCAEKVVEDDKVVNHMIDFVTEGVLTGNLALNHKINLSSDETEEEKATAKSKQLLGAGDN